MQNFYAVLRFNNICYSDLKDKTQRKEVEFWVEGLSSTDIGKLILSEYPDMYIYLNTDGILLGDMKIEIKGNNLADDLLTRIIKAVYPNN